MPSLDANTDQSKRDFRRKLVRSLSCSPALKLMRENQVYFRSQPAQRTATGDCRLVVRRELLFEDAYAQIMGRMPSDLRKRLLITFRGEEGLDYGGVSR